MFCIENLYHFTYSKSRGNEKIIAQQQCNNPLFRSECMLCIKVYLDKNYWQNIYMNCKYRKILKEPQDFLCVSYNNDYCGLYCVCVCVDGIEAPQ